MEKIIIYVDEEKAGFIKELIGYFDFVEIMEVEKAVEPRVYQGANFEIRSKNKVNKIVEDGADPAHLFDEVQNEIEGRDLTEKERENFRQIRDALSAIERKRNKLKK